MNLNRRDFLALSASAFVEASHSEAAPPHFTEREFLLGTEYYRAPMPPQEFWDADFAAIRRTGMRIVRTFSYWNWIEPAPGRYELDDFDRLFETARKHDLLLWFDLTLATHGAAPEWMMKKHPDMRVVSDLGDVALAAPGNAMPQGRLYHCYDHPKWAEYGEGLIRAVVGRYKDAPNLLMWNVWDGVAPGHLHAGSRFANGCYCEHSLAAYRKWLQQQYTLDQLNRRLDRRYRDWALVEPPRTNANPAEALLWRGFQHDDLRAKVKWQVDLVRSIDSRHELRGHGAHFPRYWDEKSAAELDSWGYSAPTSGTLTGDDPYRFSNMFLASSWSRSVGKGGRWWYEEIYAGMNPGSLKYKKQTTPEEISLHVWLAVAAGASGALFWQYRPEYMAFEAPGLNLVSASGAPLPRLKAVEQTSRELERVKPHLPISIPKAEVAVIYHDKSGMLHEFASAPDDYLAGVRSAYRTIWRQNIPVDLITPAMDWSAYKMVYLPGALLLDEELIAKIRAVLQSGRGPNLVADGLLGTHAPNGRFSYNPPEGLTDLLGVKTLDYTRLTSADLSGDGGRLRTENGLLDLSGESNYVGLDVSSPARPMAWYRDQVVGVETPGRRFVWLTLSIATAFNETTRERFIGSLLQSYGIQAPVRTGGDRIIVQQTRSKSGGWLLFLFNLETKAAQVELTPSWKFSLARDLVDDRAIPVQGGRFAVEVAAGSIRAIHCGES